jgi:hypothetical protein
MRMLKPSPGELADRQTILTLKVDHCDVEFDENTDMKQSGGVLSRTVIPNKNKTNVHPFLDELELIAKKLKEAWVPDIENKPGAIKAYDELYDELLDTNASLWKLEDKIRDLYKAPKTLWKDISWLEEVRDTSFGIMNTNNKRSELVQKINALWNINQQEKLYA